MDFKLDKAIEILERTPGVIEELLKGLAPEWVMNNEGNDTWSTYDIVGHLIHGEKTDWMIRMEIILSDNDDKTFQPFDRFAQFEQSKGKTLQQLIDEFKELRKQNIAILISKNINDSTLNKTGTHPAFGSVTLSQLLSTWVVHDLSHIAQIARVMAKQYKTAVGPWQAYLPIVN